MKIAIVTSSFPLRADDPAAAAGAFVRDFAIALARQGHELHVLTQDKGWGYDDRSEDFEVHCFPWRGGERPLASLSPKKPQDLIAIGDYLRSGRRAIRQLHQDVGLDHTLAMWAVPGGFLHSICSENRRFRTPSGAWDRIFGATVASPSCDAWLRPRCEVQLPSLRMEFNWRRMRDEWQMYR